MGDINRYLSYWKFLLYFQTAFKCLNSCFHMLRLSIFEAWVYLKVTADVKQPDQSRMSDCCTEYEWQSLCLICFQDLMPDLRSNILPALRQCWEYICKFHRLKLILGFFAYKKSESIYLGFRPEWEKK